MNIFKTGPALLKVAMAAMRYNKNKPEFEKLRQAEDYAGEQALILEKSKVFTEEVRDILKINYVIEGEENIPQEGPIMVYCNHQSLLDIPAILYLFRNHFQMGFIAKDEWRKVGVLAMAIEYTRSVFLIRDNPREAVKVVRQTADYIQKGFSLCIYPEGTRSQQHEMAEFKAGALKFAEKSGVPILPVTLDGGYKVFEETGNYVPNQTIKIKVHPLVHIEQMDKAARKEAYTQIEATVRNGLN